jgi:hypothetical protein
VFYFFCPVAYGVQVSVEWSPHADGWAVRAMPVDAVMDDYVPTAQDRLDAQNWCVDAERRLGAFGELGDDLVQSELLALGVDEGAL